MLRPLSKPALVGVRLLAIVLFVAWAWQGPIRRRVLGVKDGLTWGYIFFRAQGSKVCDIRYYEVEEGELEYIERWKVFGYESPDDMPHALRIVGPKKKIAAHTAKFCGLLKQQRGGPVEVRAHISCPDKQSWHVVEAGERDVCDPRSAKKKRKKKTRKNKKAKKK